MVEKTLASPRLHRDPRSRLLIEYLEDLAGRLDVIAPTIYYDFPIFRDESDRLFRANVLFASRSHGIVIFRSSEATDDTLSGEEIRKEDHDLSQLHSIVFGKFLRSPLLRTKLQTIKPPLTSILLLTDVTKASAPEPLSFNSTVLYSLNEIDEKMRSMRLPADGIISETEWSEVRSLLEGAKGIIRPKERPIAPGSESTKRAILSRLETEIANFDVNQRRAAISIVDGPQRIRGLAGSGKTIVLAMKAAHLHLSDPEAQILFTFYTKSLYGFIRRLITRFYRQFNDRDPDWERIHVRHGWGSQQVDGVYRDASLRAGIRPIPLKEAVQRNRNNPFDYVCSQLLSETSLESYYDYVLMDEAQDFPASFYRICFALAKGSAYDRNIVWAYDELQSIFDVRVQNPRDAFGVDSEGVALVDLDRAADRSSFANAHDIVLKKCYRNPREVLICAHALGFGIYSDTIVQMLENKEHWEDVGYAVEKGDCRPGQDTVIYRPSENSPLTISTEQTANELIEYYTADNAIDEVKWVVRELKAFIEDGLEADDIMIIALDDRNARNFYFAELAKRLAEEDIKALDVLADPYGDPTFALPDHVTLTTVYRAKGNEAPVVFALGLDALFPDRKSQRGRNKLFTAFTRAKGWLRVSGIAEYSEVFTREIDVALKNMPRMKFTYPDPQKIITLQRDLTDRAAKLRRLSEEMERQLEQLELDEEEREFFFSSIRNKA